MRTIKETSDGEKGREVHPPRPQGGEEIRDYEKRHKNRKTLVESLDRNV